MSDTASVDTGVDDSMSILPTEDTITTLTNPDTDSLDVFTPRGDASSIASGSSGPRVREEKDSGTNWMGTWFGTTRKSKPARPAAVAPRVATPERAEADGINAGKEDTSGADSDAATPVPPDVVTHSKSTRRRAGKSVFGTLGFSILNPTTSTVARKRRTKSVAELPPSVAIMPPEEASIKEEGPASATPVQAQFFQSHVPEADTGSINQEEPGSRPESVSLKEERPPQGAALRAIVNATRVMTADPTSVLDDHGQNTSELITTLAYDLVRSARDQGVVFREPQKEKRDKARLRQNTLRSAPEMLDARMGQEELGQALTIKTDGARVASKSRRGTVMADAFASASPILGSFIAQQHRRISTALDAVQKGVLPAEPSITSSAPPGTLSSPATASRRPGSLPLESIIPASAKPPTQYLSRTYTPVTARDFRAAIPLPHAVARLSIHAAGAGGTPLADRYGFLYDVAQYDFLLLLRARACGNTAPACLTGVKIADRSEDDMWPEEGDSNAEAIDVVKGMCECDGKLLDGNEMDSKLGSSGEVPSDVVSLSRSRGTSPASTRSRRRPRSPTGASTAAPTSSPAKAETSVLAVSEDTPRHACANTVRTLLDELTAMHDSTQEARKKEWDIFVRQRRRAKVSKSSGANAGMSSTASSAAAVLGLGTDLGEEELAHTEGLIGFAQLGLAGTKDERRELHRLVRGGIPLVYRSKVWFECSGGLEMREPGLFHDLLAQEGDEGVGVEIEKDVGRTMPLNIFFGGDGAGVDKLRRVLTAYSRCVISLICTFLITLRPLQP
jgi:hypothetical protein